VTRGATARRVLFPIRRLFVRVWVYALPLLALACVTLPHLDQGDWRGDQGWYGAIGVQAWRTGELWTLMAWDGLRYFNKPPLVFWIHGWVLDRVWVSLAMARLPTVFAAGLCVLAATGTARTLSGRKVGVLSGVALALTYEFFRRTREVSLDMWQAAFLLLAAWCVAVGVSRGRGAWVAAGGLWIGLAIMTKPLVGLLAIPMLGAWAAWHGGWGWRRIGVWFGSMTLVALLVAMPWHVSMWLIHGEDFLARYFGAEIGARAAGELDPTQGSHKAWWFYLHRFGAHGWPWNLFAVLAACGLALGRVPTRHRGLVRLGLVWAVAWIVLLSLFAEKRDRYMLPVHAGVAWLASAWIVWGGWGWIRRLARLGVRRGAIVLVIGGLVFAALPVRVQRGMSPEWSALIAWIRSTDLTDPSDHDDPRPVLLMGGLGANDAARVYLYTGWWAGEPMSPATDLRGGRVREPRVGDYLVYEDREGWGPGAGEAVVWTVGPVTLTRLEALPWSPVRLEEQE